MGRGQYQKTINIWSQAKISVYLCFCGYSVIKWCLTLCNFKDYITPGSPVLHYHLELLRFMSTESVMLSNHLIICHPFLHLPSIFPSIRVFSSELALHSRWPKYWSFSFNNSPSNEYLALISFKTDWFELLAVQGTLKSFLQHHNSKASILHHLAFFMDQLSHPYMTTEKTIPLTLRTFVGNVLFM